MGSHQAAHPTPPSSVKLCRVLLRRNIQGCATYMHFEKVSFYFTFGAILKSCHLSCSFTAKGRNPWKKQPFFWALHKLEGGSPIPIDFDNFSKGKKFARLRAGRGAILALPKKRFSFVRLLQDSKGHHSYIIVLAMDTGLYFVIFLSIVVECCVYIVFSSIERFICNH